jgi:hypothetical protein
VAWTLYALIITQFSDVTSLVEPIGGGSVIQVWEFVSRTFGFDYNLLGLAIKISFEIIPKNKPKLAIGSYKS